MLGGNVTVTPFEVSDVAEEFRIAANLASLYHQHQLMTCLCDIVAKNMSSRLVLLVMNSLLIIVGALNRPNTYLQGSCRNNCQASHIGQVPWPSKRENSHYLRHVLACGAEKLQECPAFFSSAQMTKLKSEADVSSFVPRLGFDENHKTVLLFLSFCRTAPCARNPCLSLKPSPRARELGEERDASPTWLGKRV